MKSRHPSCPLTALRGVAGIGLREPLAPQVNPMTAPRASVRLGAMRARI